MNQEGTLSPAKSGARQHRFTAFKPRVSRCSKPSRRRGSSFLCFFLFFFWTYFEPMQKVVRVKHTVESYVRENFQQRPRAAGVPTMSSIP